MSEAATDRNLNGLRAPACRSTCGRRGWVALPYVLREDHELRATLVSVHGRSSRIGDGHRRQHHDIPRRLAPPHAVRGAQAEVAVEGAVDVHHYRVRRRTPASLHDRLGHRLVLDAL